MPDFSKETWFVLFYFVFLFCDPGIEPKILCTPGNLKPADLARLAGGMCPGALLSSLPAPREGDRHSAPSHLYSKREFELRSLHLPGKHSTTEPHSSPEGCGGKTSPDAAVERYSSTVKVVGTPPEPSTSPYGEVTTFVHEEWRDHRGACPSPGRLSLHCLQGPRVSFFL